MNGGGGGDLFSINKTECVKHVQTDLWGSNFIGNHIQIRYIYRSIKGGWYFPYKHNCWPHCLDCQPRPPEVLNGCSLMFIKLLYTRIYCMLWLMASIVVIQKYFDCALTVNFVVHIFYHCNWWCLTWNVVIVWWGLLITLWKETLYFDCLT